jgi:hypothetical protein
MRKLGTLTLTSAFPVWPNLLLALLCLVTWAALAFVLGPQPGAVHLLLALGTTLLVRWWALRA